MPFNRQSAVVVCTCLSTVNLLSAHSVVCTCPSTVNLFPVHAYAAVRAGYAAAAASVASVPVCLHGVVVTLDVDCRAEADQSFRTGVGTEVTTFAPFGVYGYRSLIFHFVFSYTCFVSRCEDGFNCVPWRRRFFGAWPALQCGAVGPGCSVGPSAWGLSGSGAGVRGCISPCRGIQRWHGSSGATVPPGWRG